MAMRHQIVGHVGTTAGSRLYRARRLDDDAPVMLRQPATDNADIGHFAHFRHEYLLLQSLDVPGVAKPKSLIDEDGCPTMLLDDFAGESLEAILNSGQRMDLPTCLSIASRLAHALAGVHAAQVIHRDIRPVNILATRDGGQVLLVDFSIATSRDQAFFPNHMAAHSGDWAYMSPEQTGRMNLSVDYRTDFYSLGITLYRMLTGRLPFAAEDPLEWAHCHIARVPPSPRQLMPDVPQAVSDIVMKLLAKLPEERYHSAEGLCRDLDNCRTQWQATGRIAAFPLGREDFSGHFRIPHGLYGREPEAATLRVVFEQMAASGRPTLVTIAGYAGLGKSALVETLRAPTIAQHGYFITGKFEQYLHDTPYATLTQAFRELTRQLLTETETRLADWKQQIQEAVGANGQVIVEVLPQLELILGKQPPAAELPPFEAQNRFRRVFRQFLGVFARPHHPLVLFLDDVQWIDAASLQLIGHLLADADTGHLLMVVAYRDNEVSATHPLLAALDAIRRHHAAVTDIRLAPLSLPQLNRLVANTLHVEAASCEPLAHLVFDRTGGNPFFFIQFLDALHREGVLQWNAQERGWQWDLDEIKARDFADNVVDLMVGKLWRLPMPTLESLQLAACLGNKFDLRRLEPVSGMTRDEITQRLSSAIHEGVIVQIDDTGKFLHDRIQQAAYSLIPEERRNEIHLHIGRVLHASLSEDELDAQLFDVVNQFNFSAGLLTGLQEKEQVAGLNLRAGRKAKVSAAYASACVYLAAGMALLEEKDWERRYELMFNLWLERAHCELLSNRIEAAARLIDVLLQRSASNIDKAAVYSLQILQHSIKFEMQSALNSGLACLRLFDIDIPFHPAKERAQAEYEQVWRCLGDRPIESLIDLPRLNDPGIQAAMQVLSDLIVPALSTDTNLHRIILCHMVILSLKHGVSGASAIGLIGISPAFADTDSRSFQSMYRFSQLGIDLVEKHGFFAHKAKAYSAMANAIAWVKPLEIVLDYIEKAFRAAMEVGDLLYACFGCVTRVTHIHQKGIPLDEVWRESEKALDFCGKNGGYSSMRETLVGRQRFILAMQGRTASLSSFCERQFDEAAFEAQQTAPGEQASSFYWSLKLMACVLAGDYMAALAAAEKAQEFIALSSCSVIPTLDYHYFTALTITAVYETGSADAQRAWRARLAEHEALLSEWAKSCPPTFRDKHALVAAEVARLDGRDAEALHLYEQAIQSAHDNGFVQNEGIVHELAAGFCLARGFQTAGKAHLEQARVCYARWGADGKVRQLDARHPQLRAQSVRVSAAAAERETRLDLLSVTKALQAISSRIVLDELIDTLMRIMLETAGAQTGCLLLARHEELALVAEARVEQQSVQVHQHAGQALPQAQLPLTILQYVRRSREQVLLMDAAEQHPFSPDPYFAGLRPKSVLCLPIVRQSGLVGVLYLENNLATHAFTPDRVQVLELLASQAAISLDNARLYADVRNSHARIRRLVESNIIGIYFWDVSGNIIDANEAFLEMTGYSRQDLLAGEVNWECMTLPEYKALDEQKAVEVRTTRTCTPYEKEFLRKDGSRIPVLIGAVLFDDSPDHGVAFVLDLSERKQAEAEREARHAAEAANRAKSVFLANMSHELRTPLNGILGYAQILERAPALGERELAGVNVIKKSGEHLLTLISDILDLAKIEAGKMELYPADIPLPPFVQGIAEIVGVKAAQKVLELVCDCAPDLPPRIQADEKRLRQVLLNLLSNAVKFTDRGRITLRVRFAPPARLCFEVQDTGIGIAADQLEAIFEPFEQAGDMQQRVGGTGLGLAISRQYVRLMGGDIQIESQPGQGSTFRFEVQAPPVQAATVAASAKAVTGYAGPRRKILVVDDIAESRAVVIDLLTSLGFEVTEAANGREGLEMAQRLRPDLILMDIAMSELDGLAATRHLRQLDALREVPVIAVSASVSDSDNEQCLAAGMNAFLPKPVDADKLLEQMGRLLRLEWTYGAAQAESLPEEEPMVVLPAEEIEILYRLAKLGNMRDIMAQVDRLARLDERYRPFADQLSALARNYQSKAVLRLVEEYRQGSPTSSHVSR